MIDWLDEFYTSPETRLLLEESYAPLFTELGTAVAGAAGKEVGIASPAVGAFVQSMLQSYVNRYMDSSRAQLQELVGGEDPGEAIAQRLAEWGEKRPGKVAAQETFRTANAVTETVYKDAGVTRKKWNARGKSCPYCKRMDGKVVGIDRPFHKEGDAIEVPDSEIAAKAKLNFTHEIGHPPQHAGCDCVIEADLGSVEGHPSPEDTAAYKRALTDKEYAWRYSHDPSEGGVNYDNFMTDLGNEIGFGGMPEHLTRAQFDEAVSNGALELVRGERKLSYVNQFVSGEYRQGLGQYGNGVYAAWGPAESTLRTAQIFGGPDGGVIRMVLKPGARIIDYDVATKLAGKVADTYDIGRWAMMNGYDAIKVSYADRLLGSGALRGFKEGEMVILNRSVVQVLV